MLKHFSKSVVCSGSKFSVSKWSLCTIVRLTKLKQFKVCFKMYF